MGQIVKQKNKAARRLPESYRLRCLEAGLTQWAVAQASGAYHPGGYGVTPQFVNQCLLRRGACPAWLRRQLDQMLAEVDGE